MMSRPRVHSLTMIQCLDESRIDSLQLLSANARRPPLALPGAPGILTVEETHDCQLDMPGKKTDSSGIQVSQTPIKLDSGNSLISGKLLGL